MSEENELYVKSQERWQKEQSLLIEMIKENLRNSNKMIDIHTRNAELLKESLEFEEYNLQRNNELFKEWKANN